jgi:YVTN family beta-propeller protein
MVYALDRGGPNSVVYVFDANTNSYVASIPVSSGSSAYLAANPNTNKVYVTNEGASGGISVINGNTNTVSATIPGSYGGQVVVNPNTNTIYAGQGFGASILVIDGNTDAVTATITPPTHNSFFLAVNPNTNRLYALDPVNNLLYTYSGTTLLSTTSVPGSGFEGIEIDPKANLVYALQRDGTIDVLDGNTGQFLRTMQIPPPSSGLGGLYMAVDPDSGNIYVTDYVDNVAYLLNRNGDILQTMATDCLAAMATLSK